MAAKKPKGSKARVGPSASGRSVRVTNRPTVSRGPSGKVGRATAANRKALRTPRKGVNATKAGQRIAGKNRMGRPR